MTIQGFYSIIPPKELIAPQTSPLILYQTIRRTTYILINMLLVLWHKLQCYLH